MHLFMLLLLVVSFSQSTPAVARAEGADAAALAEARERFRRGVTLYEERQLEPALAEFQRAYEIAPNYAVLFNIGQVQAQLGEYPAAVLSFERYLSRGASAMSRSRRQEVESELVRLRALVARISVTLDREVPAAIFLDGAEVGQAPLEQPLLVGAGRHTVEVRAGDAFLPYRREVMVAGGEVETVAVQLSRAVAPGAIDVAIALPGVTVTLDGEIVGTTPLDRALNVDAGHHVIEASRHGYERARAEVDVEPATLAQVELSLQESANLPAELTGELEVEVSEPDAQILVDGQPLVRALAPIGPHVVTVEREGFEPWSRQVEVVQGAAVRLEAELAPTLEHLSAHRARARAYRLGAWLTAGLGAALIGATVGLFVWNYGRDEHWQEEEDYLDEQWSLSQSGEAEIDTDEIDERYVDNEDLGDELEAWGYVEFAGLGLGVAALAVSIYLFIAGPDPNRYAGLASRLALFPQRDGLGLAVSF